MRRSTLSRTGDSDKRLLLPTTCGDHTTVELVAEIWPVGWMISTSPATLPGLFGTTIMDTAQAA